MLLSNDVRWARPYICHSRTIITKEFNQLLSGKRQWICGWELLVVIRSRTIRNQYPVNIGSSYNAIEIYLYQYWTTFHSIRSSQYILWDRGECLEDQWGNGLSSTWPLPDANIIHHSQTHYAYLLLLRLLQFQFRRTRTDDQFLPAERGRAHRISICYDSFTTQSRFI